MEKNSNISLFILIFCILSMIIGLLGGYIISEKLLKTDDINNTDNNINDDDNHIQDFDSENVDILLSENLKSKGISFVDPLKDGNKIYDSSISKSASFTFGNQTITISQESSVAVLTKDDGNEVYIELVENSDGEYNLTGYIVNDYLVMYNFVEAGPRVTVYDKELNKVFNCTNPD